MTGIESAVSAHKKDGYKNCIVAPNIRMKKWLRGIREAISYTGS